MADLMATTTTSAVTALPDAVVDAFGRSLEGDLLSPDDDGYDGARSLWNAMHDRRPALIVSCAGVSDIVTSINFARTHSIPVAVRGGGHNVSGSGACEGGLMLDMSRLKRIRVDPVSRTAHAEPGLTWGELDRETQAVGLATTGGICSEAGIAGVTLGGGFGWLMRKHGLSLDNLLSVDVVSADGRLRHASTTEHADLFAGVRGAHSNFGVVTSLEYRLHPVGPTVLAGMVLHPLEKARDVLAFYREFTSRAPEEMSAWAALLTSPDGQPMVAILACYIGPVETGEAVVQSLKDFGPPVMDMIQPMPYVQAQSLVDAAFPRGRFNYWKSSLLNGLSDAAINALVTGFREVTSPYTSVLIEQLGGAVGRAARDETAFTHRDSPYDLVIMPMWSAPAEAEKHIRWADLLWQAMQPFSSGGVYVNYLGNEGEERIKAAYGASYEQLTRLKGIYDPTNLFRFNQNIQPTVSSSSGIQDGR
jgi:FAD/FMN-containing dehydrogenase